MKNVLIALAVFSCSVVGSSTCNAGSMLFEYAFNVDGTVSNNSSPGNVNSSLFSTVTGLGTISATFSSPGAHYFGIFLDHEIDEPINTFFNELGSDHGVLASGQSWEIGDPLLGTIYADFAASALTSSNSLGGPDDVSMALAWSFSLLADEVATFSVQLSESAPSSGFYLQHFDPASNSSVFFSGSYSVANINSTVPEPATWMIAVVGFGGAIFLKRRKS